MDKHNPVWKKKHTSEYIWFQCRCVSCQICSPWKAHCMYLRLIQNKTDAGAGYHSINQQYLKCTEQGVDKEPKFTHWFVLHWKFSRWSKWCSRYMNTIWLLTIKRAILAEKCSAKLWFYSSLITFYYHNQ